MALALDSYFSVQRMAEFEPVCREIAAKLIARLPRNSDVELTTEFADVFAIEVQCAVNRGFRHPRNSSGLLLHALREWRERPSKQSAPGRRLGSSLGVKISTK
jgi:cytochrome P450